MKLDLDVGEIYEEFSWVYFEDFKSFDTLIFAREKILEFIQKIPKELCDEFFRVISYRVDYEKERAVEFGEYLLNKIKKS